MKLSKQKQQLLVAYLSELIGAEAANGKFSPSFRVFDYEGGGKRKSLYLDWRTQSQMRNGVFSYSGEFVSFAKKEYEAVIILNEDDFSMAKQWLPKQADTEPRFIKSCLEGDGEPIYTLIFDNSKLYGYENQTD